MRIIRKIFTFSEKTLYLCIRSLYYLLYSVGKYSQYKISLRSLPEGKSEYDYHLDDKFFVLIDSDSNDIKKGDLNVKLVIQKTANTFECNFIINGTVTVPCDRCLDDLKMEVGTKNRLIVKFGKEYSEESDEIVIIPEDDGEINIVWFLYEFIALSLPMKKVHPQGECNKTVSSKLRKYKISDTNDDDDDLDSDDIELMDEETSTDSRWDTLKNINLDED